MKLAEDLEKVLSSPVPGSVAGAEEAEPVTPAPKSRKFGYRAFPRPGYVFVKPVPKDHPGRLITPPAYEPAADMGFIHAVGEVCDLSVGDLVLFDKFAEIGSRFELLDENDELVEMVQLRQEFITAVLERVKLEE
jgi:hypothetical protein